MPTQEDNVGKNGLTEAQRGIICFGSAGLCLLVLAANQMLYRAFSDYAETAYNFQPATLLPWLPGLLAQLVFLAAWLKTRGTSSRFKNYAFFGSIGLIGFWASLLIVIATYFSHFKYYVVSGR